MGRYDDAITNMLAYIKPLESNQLSNALINVMCPARTLAGILQKDILQYLTYIAISDGRLSVRDAEYISDVFDKKYSTADLYKVMADGELNTYEYDISVPCSLKIFVEIDKALYPETYNNHSYKLAELYMLLYQELCQGLFAYNGKFDVPDLTRSESTDYGFKARVMQEYIRNNCSFVERDIIMVWANKGKHPDIDVEVEIG